MSDATPAPIEEVESLGAYLRTARNAAGLSQRQLAGRIGVTQQSVQQWETGTSVPSPRALHFLAEQLPGLDPVKLLALIPSGTR